jgi:hypothetical protein
LDVGRVRVTSARGEGRGYTADMAATRPTSAPAPMPTRLGQIVVAAALMAPLVAAEPPAPFASPLGLGLKEGTAKGVVAVLPCSVPAGLIEKPYDWPSLTGEELAPSLRQRRQRRTDDGRGLEEVRRRMA